MQYPQGLIMITPFDIYLIGIISNLNDSLGIFVAIGLILSAGAAGMALAAKFHGDGDNENKLLKISFRIFKVTLCVLVLGQFIPDKKTLAAMYVMPKMANSQLVQNIPSYVQTFIEKELNNNGDNAEDGQ
jgi:hypothetical protein